MKPWLQSVPFVKLSKLKRLNCVLLKQINRILNKKVELPATYPLISFEATKGKLLMTLILIIFKS
jgi:hypothetical protein